MKRLFVFLLLFFSFAVNANTGRILQLQGTLVTYNKSSALIKDDKGIMKVPIAAIDQKHVRIGQWIVVNIDVVDFYRMNPDKFK